MYNLTMDPETHQGDGLGYEAECNRHHTPLWEALGEDEPAFWLFRCDCCNTTYGTQHGGYARLDSERADDMAADAAASKGQARIADLHGGREIGKYGLVPYHASHMDPMHGLINTFNEILSEVRGDCPYAKARAGKCRLTPPMRAVPLQSIQNHLNFESPHPSIRAKQQEAEQRVNARLQATHTPKYIKFGRDNKGEHSHAADGPTTLHLLHTHGLLVGLMQDMAEVWALMESTDDLPRERAERAASAEQAATEEQQEGSSQQAGKQAGKRKAGPRMPPKKGKFKGQPVATSSSDIAAAKSEVHMPPRPSNQVRRPAAHPPAGASRAQRSKHSLFTPHSHHLPGRVAA